MNILLFVIKMCFLKLINTTSSNEWDIVESNIINFQNLQHYKIVEDFYAKRRDWRTSTVGTLLFKAPEMEFLNHIYEKRQTILIYIWNNWSILLTGEDVNPLYHSKLLEGCSVKNCVFTRRKSFARKANAVLVNIHGDVNIPKTVSRYRNPNQLWILYSFESPMNLFKNKSEMNSKLHTYANIFNWTMTYRTDADVPIPYGRVVPLAAPRITDISSPSESLFELVPYWSNKSGDVLLSVLVANCKIKRRMNFIQNLKKFINIDVFGNCFKSNKFNASCVGHINSDCRILSQYKFYLDIEAARCRQYFTEKLYFFAYSKGAIPIIWGASLEDCQQLLPPNSYLHISNYRSYKQLVAHVNRIADNENELIKYHEWRNHFQVINEHGYHGTKPTQFCRLCEALNYNSNGHQNMYNFGNLSVFIDPQNTCW